MKRSTDREFVRAWVVGKTIASIAEIFSISGNSVYCRATRMRRRGIKLPYRPMTNIKASIEELNALITTLESELVEE